MTLLLSKNHKTRADIVCTPGDGPIPVEQFMRAVPDMGVEQHYSIRTAIGLSISGSAALRVSSSRGIISIRDLRVGDSIIYQIGSGIDPGPSYLSGEHLQVMAESIDLESPSERLPFAVLNLGCVELRQYLRTLCYRCSVGQQSPNFAAKSLTLVQQVHTLCLHLGVAAYVDPANPHYLKLPLWSPLNKVDAYTAVVAKVPGYIEDPLVLPAPGTYTKCTINSIVCYIPTGELL